MIETIHEFNGDNGGVLQQALGTRPDKVIDTYYLRRSGFSGKWMFWSEETGKYERVHVGDRFYVDTEGVARRAE